MMSMREAIEADALHGGTRCTVSTLPANVRAEFDELVVNLAIPGAKISRALKRVHNADVSAWIIQRHRRGDCDCGQFPS